MKIENYKDRVLEENREIIDVILNNQKNKRPIYIMGGLNSIIDDVLNFLRSKKVRVTGFIDDYSTLKSYQSIPVFPLKSLESNDCIIIVCAHARPLTIQKILRKNGFNTSIFYFHLYLIEEDWLNTVLHCKNNIKDIEFNKQKYNRLFGIMADLESKDTLQNLINLRYNFDIKTMVSYSCDIDNQYFDAVVNFEKDEVFVDCGGYDGDTTKRFIEKCPDYAKVFFFEPYHEYCDLARRDLGQYRNISYYRKATYDKNATLKFAVSNQASALDEKGSFTVEACRLDDIIKERVTYLKMDVEGAEFESLIGAQNLIQRYKPKLAICVYHKQEHFWHIPELVLGINDSYKVYLRHYSEGFSETVMYFV